MWNCDSDDCQNPTVRRDGGCLLCNRRFCASHLEHGCPKWEDETAYDPAYRKAEETELTALINKININALASQASQLRGGIQCSINPPSYDMSSRGSVMGGMNFHIDVRFEDGVSWLARIRRCNATSPPPNIRDAIIRSEVATLKFLENIDIPTPKVFGFDLEGKENPVGVGYIFLEKLKGKSLSWSLASPQQKTKVMNQVADIYIELQRHSFELMGSLELQQDGTQKIGPFAKESLADVSQTDMRLIGPCSSMEGYYRSILQLTLKLILRKEVCTTQPIDAYLIHLFLLESLPTLLAAHKSIDDNRFYLKHADDKGDHILVDDNYNVTGVIDWEWAYTTSMSAAFNSPVGFLHVSEFYKGVTNIGDDELKFVEILESKGYNNLANAVRNGRAYHFFEFCCGYDLSDWNGFLGLFQGLRTALGDEQSSWEIWKEAALDRYKSDDGLRTLLSGS
ncbi:hypothetical protein FQN57_006181 [Myotisia sp. PD_48]|nr:hypothetical protein FQN57_006181 [Myotisia sp. PD_48]